MPETFLLDESVDQRIIRKLKPLGLNTISVSVVACGIPDDEVLNLAELHDAILITEDRDFGDWIFAHGRQGVSIIQIHRLILATKAHKGTQRKKEYPNHTNEKLLEVQKPFLEKVFGRRRQKLTVDFGLYIYGIGTRSWNQLLRLLEQFYQARLKI